MTDKDSDTKSKVTSPGWNDPPFLSYESHQTHSRQSKGIQLNKRVVFPISSKTDLQKECSPSGAVGPPPFGITPPRNIAGPSKNLQSNKVDSSSEETSDGKKSASDKNDVPSLDHVLENFSNILQQVFKNEEKEAAEVKRRLAIMENLWKEEKFNDIVKESIFKLTIALEDNKFDDAENLQRSLVVDHSRVCSSWMVAVRKLIYLKKRFTKFLTNLKNKNK